VNATARRKIAAVIAALEYRKPESVEDRVYNVTRVAGTHRARAQRGPARCSGSWRPVGATACSALTVTVRGRSTFENGLTFRHAASLFTVSDSNA
jgi:hypothetical protein